MTTEPEKLVKKVGLRYMPDEIPGISRRSVGRGFIYVGAEGRRIVDRDELARIKALVIPPAWKN